MAAPTLDPILQTFQEHQNSVCKIQDTAKLFPLSCRLKFPFLVNGLMQTTCLGQAVDRAIRVFIGLGRVAVPERKINHESSWKGWQDKRRIGRRKISRSIPARTVLQMINAWYFARDLKLPFNRFVTIRPSQINDMTPDERVAYWETARNKIGQFARDNNFEHVSLWSRESSRDTGDDEHLHLLTHVPPSLADRFDGTANSWYGEGDEIKIKPADYRQRRQRSGNIHTAVTYLAKNSPQAARVEKLRLTYRLGGPILGKRVGWSRNVSPKAQEQHEARYKIQGEFGQARAIRADLR